MRCNATVRMLGPVDSVTRERPETGAQHRRHGLTPEADFLTPCMPCHPHHHARPSAASLGTTSALLKQVEGRGAVM